MNEVERANIKKWIRELKQMETNHLPELDHKDCGILAEYLEELYKAQRFVDHVQHHLDHDLPPDQRGHGKVMCKICCKTIDEISRKEIHEKKT